MGLLFVYILKASFCLALFYLFYRLLLSKETFHRFNRISLLTVLVLSCLLPLLALMGEGFRMSPPLLAMMKEAMLEAGTERADVFPETPSPFPWYALMLLVYAAGVLFFLVRFLWSVARMLRLLRTSRIEQMEGGISLFVHQAKVAPFSWMKVIVVSEEDLKEGGQAILTHECAHIRNLHSWDLLLVEACVLLQWFNPAVWLLKQELQNIHEYEADEWVIKNGIDAKTYQLLIIQKAVGKRLYSMVNSFNHSSLKKRIAMMIKKKSSPWARLKCLYVLPLATITVTALAHPEVADKLDDISNARIGQLVSTIGMDEQDVLKYSFLDSKGLPNTIEMRRSANSTSRLIDSVRVVVDEVLAGYGQDVLNRIPGHRIKSVLAIPSEATIEITTKKENPTDYGTIGKRDEELASVMDEFEKTVTFRASKLASGSSAGIPLIIIDGEVKGNNPDILGKMDINDIESISIVKNQHIVAQLYGDKAKDGLILITTKRLGKQENNVIENK